MNPGALVPDVRHLEKVGIQLRLGTGTLEKRLMRSRRAGGNHDPVQSLFFDGGLDFCDPGLGAGVEILLGKRNPRERGRIRGYRLAVEVAGDIGSAIADKYADPGLFRVLFLIVGFFAHSLLIPL